MSSSRSRWLLLFCSAGLVVEVGSGGWGKDSWFSYCSLWFRQALCTWVSVVGFSQLSYPFSVTYNPVSYSVLKWVSQSLLCITAGLWIWKVSCPHLFNDLVQGEYIRFSCQLSHPKTKKILLESWQGLGMWWFVAPPPGTDDFCLTSLRALSRCGISCFSHSSSQLLLYIRGELGASPGFILSPWNHHLVLVQGPEHGWYGCSTLKVLQVSHEPAPPVGLSQVSSPPPIFLMNKELFRESKGYRYTELSCYPIIGLYKFVDLLSVFLLPTYMATPLLPLLYQERKSSYAPSFFRGAHHPLEFSSPDSQLRWGTQPLRNSKEFISFKAVQLFPTYGGGNILLQFSSS